MLLRQPCCHDTALPVSVKQLLVVYVVPVIELFVLPLFLSLIGYFGALKHLRFFYFFEVFQGLGKVFALGAFPSNVINQVLVIVA